MNDAPRAMRRFARELQFARRLGIEVRAARDELAHADAGLLRLKRARRRGRIARRRLPWCLARCNAEESCGSGAKAAAMPPCAHCVEPVPIFSFVSTATEPCGASSTAHDSPATPEPIIRKSKVSRRSVAGSKAMRALMDCFYFSAWRARRLKPRATTARSLPSQAQTSILSLRREASCGCRCPRLQPPVNLKCVTIVAPNERRFRHEPTAPLQPFSD